MKVTRSRLIGLMLGIAAALGATGGAPATDHLIQEGTSWELVVDRLDAGDRIILMPGEHEPMVLSDVHGTAERPITIMGVDPRHPSTIDAERYGIRITGLRHVRLENLIVRGATINGISLEGAPESETSDGDEAYDRRCGVRLCNVVIQNTGPQGLRHALNIEHLRDVQIEHCRFDGWAGSGIEVVSCSDVAISDCGFAGRADHGELSGVRVRAGSDRVQITGCRFREVGDQGVCIGGGSRFEEFASRPGEDAKAGTLFEAARVQVRRCLFQGSRCAVALVNCERSLVRNCTIHRPTRAIMSFRREQEDGRFGDVRYCAFGSNLVVWKAEDITQVAHLGPNMDASAVGIDLEDNFWWCGDAARTAAALEGLPGNELFPQVTELAPKLDEELRPTEERAKPFGAHAP